MSTNCATACAVQYIGYPNPSVIPLLNRSKRQLYTRERERERERERDFIVCYHNETVNEECPSFVFVLQKCEIIITV